MQIAQQNQYTILSKGVELTLTCPTQPGYVYLIHFEQKFKHAAHYLGSTINLDARLELHRAGTGARLMEVIKEAGISWHVSKIWPCATVEEARALESRLKGRHHDGRQCPECQGKPADPQALLYQGHWPFSVYRKSRKRQPMGTPRPVYLH